MKKPVQKLSMTGSELSWLWIKRPLGAKGADHNRALLLQFPTSRPACFGLPLPQFLCSDFRSSADNSRRFTATEFGSTYNNIWARKGCYMGCTQHGKQTERSGLVDGGWLYKMRWALRFDGAEEGSCRRLAAPFDGASGLARKLLCRIWVMQSSLWQACQNKLVCWRQIQLQWLDGEYATHAPP